MGIVYRTDAEITPEALGALFDRSGIRRPTGDAERLAKMIAHANLTVTAWDIGEDGGDGGSGNSGGRLVGVARSLTDFAWCCYLSDLAVDADYQRRGIGRALVARTRAEIGEQTMLLLLSVPAAMNYYPALGMSAVGNGWLFPRAR